MRMDRVGPGVANVAGFAAIGGMAAVLVDLFQKGDASAVFELTGTLNKLGNYLYPATWGSFPNVPVIGVGLLLIVCGIALAFMSEARSRTAAFYSGASVISVLMTLVPYDAPLPPPSGTTVDKMTMNEPHGARAHFVPATYRVGEDARLWYAAAGDMLPVTVLVHVPIKEGEQASTPPRIDGRLYDAVSGREWQVAYADPKPTSVASGKAVTYQFRFTIETGTPRGTVQADLKLRVQIAGYNTATDAQIVTQPGLPVTLEVEMQPSNVPKPVQKLQRIFDRPSF